MKSETKHSTPGPKDSQARRARDHGGSGVRNRDESGVRRAPGEGAAPARASGLTLTWAFVLSVGIAVLVAAAISSGLNFFRAREAASQAIDDAGVAAANNLADKDSIVWGPAPNTKAYTWKGSTVQPARITRRGETVDGAMYRAARQGLSGQAQYSDLVVDSPLGDFSQSMIVSLIITSAVVLLFGMGTAFLLARRVVAPLTALIEDVRILSHGNLEHRVEVRSGGEVGLLAKSVDRMIRGLRDAREAERETEMREHELAVAAEVRDSLLPEKTPVVRGYEVASHSASADSVGGDLFDTIENAAGTQALTVFVAGISARGVPGAMLMTMARAYLHQAFETQLSPAEALKIANKSITRDMRRGLFVTVLAASLDPTTGRVRVACAGHKAALLHYKALPQKIETVHPEGIALGFDPGPVFDRTIQEAEITLGPGDRIVLSNAGVAALANAEGQELGEAGFVALVSKHAPKVSEAFCQLLGSDLDRYRGESPLVEDVVIVTIKRSNAAGARA